MTLQYLWYLYFYQLNKLLLFIYETTKLLNMYLWYFQLVNFFWYYNFSSNEINNCFLYIFMNQQTSKNNIIFDFFLRYFQLVNSTRYPPQIQHLCQRIKRDFVSAPVTASRSQILEQLLSELSSLSKGKFSYNQRGGEFNFP